VSSVLAVICCVSWYIKFNCQGIFVENSTRSGKETWWFLN
jgi:hypothetical protein